MRWQIILEDSVHYEDSYERACLYGQPQQIPIFVMEQKSESTMIHPIMSISQLIPKLNSNCVIISDKYENFKEIGYWKGWTVYEVGTMKLALMGPSLKYNHLIVLSNNEKITIDRKSSLI